MLRIAGSLLFTPVVSVTEQISGVLENLEILFQPHCFYHISKLPAFDSKKINSHQNSA